MDSMYDRLRVWLVESTPLSEPNPPLWSWVLNTQPLLDTVLLCFTVDNKRDSPPTYKLAQTFVARCFEKLNTHLSTFVKQVGSSITC